MSNIVIQDGKYGYLDDDKFKPLGNAAYLIAIESNIDTGEIILSLETNYLGQSKAVKLPRNDLCSRMKLIPYAGKGLDITDASVSCFIASIKMQEELFDATQIQYVHSTIGWGNDASTNSDFKKYRSLINGVKSTYSGVLDIKPKGKKSIWVDMINQHVLPSPALTFALVVGLSAVLNGFNSNFCGAETPLVHFVGGSSTGKTTAAMLAISVAGNPSITSTGLFRSWGGTPNAIINSLVDNYGMPVAFDEASLFPGRDFSSFVYGMTSGRDKDRLTKELNLREVKGYRTVILSTGEKSILANCNNNNGIKVRILELNGVVFTKGAESADYIKNICRNNYGWALNEFIKSFRKARQKKGIEAFDSKLEQKFLTYKQMFLDACVANAFTERVVNKYALFMLTAYLTKKYLNFDIDLGALFDFIVDIDAQNNMLHSREIGNEFLHDLLSYVTTHRNLFTSFCGGEGSSYMLGRIERESTSKKINEIIVPTSQFRKITMDLGYEDSTVILNELKKLNCLRHDKGRNDVKRAMTPGGNAIRCYDILIPEVMLNDIDMDIGLLPEENHVTYDDYDNI